MLSCRGQLIERIFRMTSRKIVAQTMLDKLKKMNNVSTKF